MGRDPSGATRRATASLDQGRHHVVAVDYGIKRNILRSLAALGMRVTVVPATTRGRDILALAAGRHLPLERPGRSRRDRQLRGAADPEAARERQADVRHLPRPSDAGAGARRHHREDEVRPSRRQPSGPGPDHRQGRDHQPEPRLRGAPGQPARRRRADARVAVRRLARRACSVRDRPVFSVQYHPEASPGPQDSAYLFERFLR